MKTSATNTFSYRKANLDDLDSLEFVRLKSIENCKIYTKKQLDIWKESKPNWNQLIDNTLVCIKKNKLVGFVVYNIKLLDYLYVDPNEQHQGIGNHLVSMVETNNMKCDCNLYSEKILKNRGWKYLSENRKENSGEVFRNKWYVFNGTTSTKV